jgi:hypothetical protein
MAETLLYQALQASKVNNKINTRSIESVFQFEIAQLKIIIEYIGIKQKRSQMAPFYILKRYSYLDSSSFFILSFKAAKTSISPKVDFSTLL